MDEQGGFVFQAVDKK